VPPTERHCAGLKGAVGAFGILPRRLYGHCGASVVTVRDAVTNHHKTLPHGASAAPTGLS